MQSMRAGAVELYLGWAKLLGCRFWSRPRNMPPKRPGSNIGDDDPSEGGREVKKQKVHRGQLGAVMQDFLDMLTPATKAGLADFNEEEKKENRRGVPLLNIDRVQKELQKLRLMKDTPSLDAKLNGVQSYLEKIQGNCTKYIDYAVKNGADFQVEARLNEVIWEIGEAKDQLPGMFSHWTNYSESLNVATDRY